MSRRRSKAPFNEALARTNQPVAEYVPPSQRPRPPNIAAGDGAHFFRSLMASDQIQNMIAALGTSRDKRSHTHYAPTIPQTRFDLDNMYRCSWAAGKIVDCVADDMTREWVRLKWDNFDKDEATSRIITNEANRFDLKGKVNAVLKWARLYGGATVLIGIAGDKDLSKPLILGNVRKGALRFLHVLDRWRLAPTGEVDSDLDSPNFGLPKYYTLAETGESNAPFIHWTRVVRFDGRQLPYFIWQQNARWDDSVLQNIVDDIKDFDTGMKGAASMLWEANVDIISTQDLDLNIASNHQQKVIDRWMVAAMMKSFNRMMLIDKDAEEYHQKTTQFSGITDLIGKLMLNLSGACDIPVTRLFGQTPVGLSSTGEADIRNYYDHIASKQQAQLRRPLERLFEVIVRSATGAMPKNFEIEFNPLWQMSDSEKATAEYTRAQAAQIYEQMGAITAGLVARELKERGCFHTMTDKDVKLAEDHADAQRDLDQGMAEAQIEGAKAKTKALNRPPAPAAPAALPPGGARGATPAEAATGGAPKAPAKRKSKAAPKGAAAGAT